MLRRCAGGVGTCHTLWWCWGWISCKNSLPELCCYSWTLLSKISFMLQRPFEPLKMITITRSRLPRVAEAIAMRCWDGTGLSVSDNSHWERHPSPLPSRLQQLLLPQLSVNSLDRFKIRLSSADKKFMKANLENQVFFMKHLVVSFAALTRKSSWANTSC